MVRRSAPDPRGPAARRARRPPAPGDEPACCRWRGKLRAAARAAAPGAAIPPTRSAPSSGAGSATRSTSASSTPSSAASTPPTPTASAWRWCPQLAALAGRGRSLLLGARRRRADAPPPSGPVFLAPRGGMAALVDAVAGAAAARRRDDPHAARPSASSPPTAPRWRVDGEPFDAVVLATPAAPTAPLLAAVGAGAGPPAGARWTTPASSLVTLAVADWPERLRGRSGYLVPKPVQRPVTAASFGSQKWAHWRRRRRRGAARVARPRRAAGRRPRRRRGRRATPSTRSAATSASTCSRRPCGSAAGRRRSRSTARTTATGWRRSTPRCPPGLFVTGASYGGIGVPACIAQARRDRRAVPPPTLGVVALRRSALGEPGVDGPAAPRRPRRSPALADSA